MPDASESRHAGVLAELPDVDTLLHACEAVRDAGYTSFDAYTPYPVHGIDEAIGIRRTRIPWAIFVAGLSGAAAAVGMQWWMNAHDYAFLISGKPLWSLPANIPIAFEMTVLFAAVTAFLVTLGVCKLPQFYRAIASRERFARVTDDGLFIAVEADDPAYDRARVTALLEAAGATAVESYEQEASADRAVPGKLKLALAVLACASLVPMALAVKARQSFSDQPRIHLIGDMDNQKKLKAQAESAAFADGRAMRLPVPGTVPAGGEQLDDHFFRGVAGGGWATELPASVKTDGTTLRRGRERFGIYCAPCHGDAGYGDGMIHRRALQIGANAWVPPTSLHEEHVRAQPVGQLFHVITNGVRNMPGYGHAIPAADRWAIVTYLRALQLSQAAAREDVPATATIDPN